MASSKKEKNTNYKYKISMTYTQSNGKSIKIEHDKIMTLIIDNNYNKMICSPK